MSEPLIGPHAPDPFLPLSPANLSVRSDDSDPSGPPRTGEARLPQGQRVSVIGVVRSLTALWVVALLVTQVSLFLYQPIKPARSDGAEAVWLGTMWAGWAVSVWISSCWTRMPVRRIAFILVVLTWTVTGLSAMSGEPPARYAVTLGSYALVQAILFRWVGVPDWAPNQKRLSLAPDDIPRPQYGIGDLVVITTVIAVLIAMGQTYQAKMGGSFWWGLIFAEGLLVAIAALGVLGGLSSGSGRPLGWLLAVSLVILGGTAAFDRAEAWVTGQNHSMGLRYGVLLLSFAAWIISFTVVSMRPLRMDASLEMTGGELSTPP